MFKRLHQSWLLVGCCVGVVGGMILANILQWGFFSSPLWLVFVLLLAVIAFLKPCRLFLVVMILAGVVLAFWRVGTDLAKAGTFDSLAGKNITVIGKISEDPDIDDGSTTLRLSELSFEGQEMRGLIFVKLGGEKTELERGDFLELSGKLSSGFGNFAATMYQPKIESLKKPEPGDIFLKARNWFAGQVRANTPEKESSLALAYLTGMKNGLDKETTEKLRLVGLTHLVVASGTHLGVIVMIARKIFGRISRFSGLISSLVLIFCFGSIVGWTASITRAAIVASLSFLAWYVGRKFEEWRILLFTATLTLMINPMFLTNLGWLLSFAAFFGILVFEPKIKIFFFGEKKVNKIVDIILATVAAQLLCLPIQLYFFGTMSLIAVVANLLILPTIPIAMGLTFLVGILNFMPVLNLVLGKMVTWLIDYHFLVVDFFAKQKTFLIEIPTQNPWVFLIYAVIFLPFLIGWTKKLRQLCRRNSGLVLATEANKGNR